MTGSLLLAALSFLMVVPWGNWAVGQLSKRGIVKRVRLDGPASHQVKSGTATMGGLYILAGIGIIASGLALAGYPRALVPLVAMLVFGLLGAVDDLQGLRDAGGVGWLARHKLPWQWVLAAAVALVMFWAEERHLVALPISGDVLDIGWWWVPVTAVLIVAFSNAVNLADGLDGLAAGTSAIAYAAYGGIAGMSQPGVSLFCYALVGVLLAFLWYNVHPARLFMGDTGSQALGAGLAAVAVLSGHWVLLPIIGVVFIATALSVILQVGYFKFTRRRHGEGRRIFRMAPLHHHYELLGWSEVQITLRYWIVALVAATVGVVLGVGLR